MALGAVTNGEQTATSKSTAAIEPCLFPVLNDGNIGDDRLGRVAISNRTANAILEFCQNNDVNIRFFLVAVWSVMLSQYAEVATVQIGVGDVPAGAARGDGGRWIITSKKNMQLISAGMDREAPVEYLLQEQSWTKGCCATSSRDLFNTGVLLKYQDSVTEAEFMGDIADTDADQTCDIVLIIEIGDWPRLLLVYDSTVLSSGYAQILADTIEHTVSCIVQGAQQCLGSISLLSPRQTKQISIWSSRHAGSVTSPFVHEIIHACSLQQPNAPAICSWNGTVTYAKLIRESSKLAQHLVSLGIGPTKMVPTCFEKTRWAVVTALAVNMTGAAFVPLDPSHPRRRLESIVQQINPSLIVTSAQHRQVLGNTIPTVVVVSEDLIVNLPEVMDKPPRSVHRDDVGYVLFTSGSTGMPKGCMVGHAALASVAQHAKTLRMQAGSRVLHFASLSFGISIIEIFCTLCIGGTVCIPSDDDRFNRLGGTMTSMSVDWALLTPTVVNSLQHQHLPHLKTLVIAGEPLQKAQIELWSSKLCLLQAYGLTEWAGICSVSTPITSSAEQRHIGTPIPACWIVDKHDHNKLAPIGAVGELVIEGSSLALGYFHDPETTAAVFLTSLPWIGHGASGVMQRRFYKTGDLVRYNSDGGIAYIARKDTQTKIRGQRVELGEVEYHITQSFPGLMKKAICEIITPKDNQSQQILGAFIFSNAAEEADGSTGLLRQADATFQSNVRSMVAALQSILPSSMVPGIFLPLQRVPVTISGKVDRRQLREYANHLYQEELDSLATPEVEELVKPTTEKERIIQQTVADVLNMQPDRVGMNHNFFRLHGDSVAAMKLVGKARERHVQMTARDVFKYPVLSDLANVVTMTASVDFSSSTVPFELLDAESFDTIMEASMEQCGVTKEQIEDIYPCTALQEGLMALTAKNPRANMARFVYELRPHVEVERFESAWESIVRSNPILRTRIIQTASDGMFQVVIQDASLVEKHQNVDRYVERIDQIPMTLGGSLLHAAIILVKEAAVESSLFVLTVHHALCDRWSMQLLLGHLESTYFGRSSKSVPFSSFIAYFTQVRGIDEFWRSEFEGINVEPFPSLPSPNYTPNPENVVNHVIQIPCKMQNDYTISTTLRLAWGTVIAHYTDTSDVVFGMTLTGRNAAVSGIEQIVGPTIATVPVRVKIEDAKTVHEALATLHSHATEMIPYEQIGLQRIRRLGPEAEEASNFQSQLVIQPFWGTSEQSLLNARQVDSNVLGGFATYALSLICSFTEDNRGISVAAYYDANVLKENEVQQLVQHFDYILQELVLNPQQRVDHIPAINPKAMDQLLGWNREVPRASNVCVHELIHQRSLERPDNPAVFAWDGSFTYAELDDLSSKLAATLARLGVKPEVFVPICFEKSRWVTVAMLGVIKSGGAFVLLDPGHPEKRLENICSEVNAILILSSQQNAQLSRNLAAAVLVVGDHNASWRGRAVEYDVPVVRPENTLYAVFTSGSTGKPKGVVIEHQSFCSSAQGHIPAQFLDRESRVLQFASYAFDVSIEENLSTLIAGACLCVPSEEDRMTNIAKAINELEVNYARLTPSIARILVPDNIPTLRTLVLGGEPISKLDIAQWSPRVHLIDSYGPAECSVTTTVQSCVTVDSDPRNIGRPTSAAVCWVVNQHDDSRLVSIGAIGELLIEGPIVGRGYLNEPAQTAAAFIQAPTWLRHIRHGNEGRLYKTGDLVQYHPDGSLRYIGRKDLQAKIRGQRIELGEVEKHLRECFNGVRDVVAEVVTGINGSPSLVAFIWPEEIEDNQATQRMTDSVLALPNQPFRDEALNADDKLRDLLPSYMIPAIFLPLSQMPRGVTGKTDRRQLRNTAAALSPEQLALYNIGSGSKRAPETEAERILHAIWAQVLNIPHESIGADDNFFRLGGDSITAMRLASAARGEGLELTVADIFSHPNLSSLSQLCISKRPEADAPEFRPFSLVRADLADALHQSHPGLLPPSTHITDILPVTNVQLFFLEQWTPVHYCFYLQGEVQVDRLRDACAAVVCKHHILRSAFLTSPDGPVQVIVQSFDAPFSHIATGDDVALYCDTVWQADSAPSSTLNEFPLKFTLVSNGSMHMFVIRLSHAQYDGVSIPTLSKDIAAAYEGELSTATPQFPGYVYARSLLDHRHQPVFRFWRELLDGASMTLLPTRSEDNGFKRVSAARNMPLPTPPAGITLANLVKAAWSYVLARFTGTSDLVFGHTVHGRGMPMANIDKVLGPCLNFIPLRVKLQAEWSALDLLQHVQGQYISSISHDYLSLPDIVKNSTDWHADTYFGCIVQHQNIDQNPPLALRGADCLSSTPWAYFVPAKELWIISTPQAKKLQIMFCASTAILSSTTTNFLADQLVETIRRFSDSPETLLDLSSDCLL